jgi:serine/threonine-protein kinase
MQLVRGENLRELLDRRGPLPWPVACELMSQVADALSAARGAGIVHRDLKPENILVETREDGSYLAKILDFGIAHVAQPLQPMAEADSGDRALTRVGTVIGTPGYMSPEQAVGDKVDHRSDLYALGVVLWECLTGKPLWEAQDVMAIIMRQLHEAVPRPRDVLGDPLFPRALDQLVLKLCERKPADRPEHASLVRDALRALSRQRITPTAAVAEHASLMLSAARDRFLAMPGRSQALSLAASGAVMMALLAVIFGRRVPESPQPPAAPASVQAAQSEPTKPSFTDRAMQLAQRVVNESPLAPKPEAKLPNELEPEVQSLLEGNRSNERRRAATRIVRYKGPGHVPAYVLSVARLERAHNCREREDAIAELDELQEPRSAPALRRIADSARTGCGFLGLSDCYACVRASARDALARIPKPKEPREP